MTLNTLVNLFHLRQVIVMRVDTGAILAILDGHAAAVSAVLIHVEKQTIEHHKDGLPAHILNIEHELELNAENREEDCLSGGSLEKYGFIWSLGLLGLSGLLW
jgi:hypothetical protein